MINTIRNYMTKHPSLREGLGGHSPLCGLSLFGGPSPLVGLSLFLLLSCSSPEEKAAQAALDGYAALAEGRTADFMSMKAGYDSLPDDYRSQLAAAVDGFVGDISRRHGGLSGVTLSANTTRRDSTLDVVYAFLMLSFADSTQEEVCVPMVQTADGRWLMK